VPVLVDAAQLATHRPLPAAADFLAWSGHKMHARRGQVLGVAMLLDSAMANNASSR
jgi:selenocysteine lyase/cysteine desulfurase